MSPSEPISWHLVEFLADRVRLITKAAGFLTDIGTGRIILDDADVPENSGTPATAIAVDRITRTTGSKAQSTCDVGVVIEFSVPRGVDEENPHRLVHRARHDLLRVLSFDQRAMPVGLSSFEVTETQLAPVTDDAGNSSVVAQITARAGLTEMFQPVSLP